jgi:hypothetical protein
MASFDPSQYTANGQSALDAFMALSPQERNAYIIQGDVTPYGYAPAYGYAANLRNISGANGQALSPEQYQQILASSNIDPAMASNIAGNLGFILDTQAQQQNQSDWSYFRPGVIAGIAALGGGAALGAAGAGAGAGAAEGASAAGGATAAGGAAADFGSLVGPATGTVEAAPVIGAAGAPTVSAVASGSGPFVPTIFGGVGGANAISQALSTPASGGGTAAANGAATGTAASRILSGNGTLPDYLSVGGSALPGIIGAVGANQQADALRDIYNQSRADRAPFLSTATNYLNNPQAYINGPGQTMLDATLRKLSATSGNPIDNPTALGIATQAGLQNWQNAVLGFGNLGLAGEDTRAQLGTNAAAADANVLNALGGAAADVMNPPSTLDQLLKRLGYGSTMKGLA